MIVAVPVAVIVVMVVDGSNSGDSASVGVACRMGKFAYKSYNSPPPPIAFHSMTILTTFPFELP